MATIPWPFQIAFLAAIVGNYFWYRIKSVNKAKGYKVRYITTSDDFKNFKEVIENTEDVEQKKKYKRILIGNYLCSAVILISFMAGMLLIL